MASSQTKPEEEEEELVEAPLVLAVTIKDEYGNVDLGAIAERERLVASSHRFCFSDYCFILKTLSFIRLWLLCKRKIYKISAFGVKIR